jgi:hypothetical protein
MSHVETEDLLNDELNLNLGTSIISMSNAWTPIL